MNEIKQIILLRKDLNMTVGKACAQSSHASLNSFLNVQLIEEGNEIIKEWFSKGETKIVLGVNDEKELLKFKHKFEIKKIPFALIIDEGRTEFNNIHTTTALGIGPFYSKLLTKLTGHLPLYS